MSQQWPPNPSVQVSYGFVQPGQPILGQPAVYLPGGGQVSNLPAQPPQNVVFVEKEVEKIVLQDNPDHLRRIDLQNAEIAQLRTEHERALQALRDEATAGIALLQAAQAQAREENAQLRAAQAERERTQAAALAAAQAAALAEIARLRAEHERAQAAQVAEIAQLRAEAITNLNLVIKNQTHNQELSFQIAELQRALAEHERAQAAQDAQAPAPKYQSYETNLHASIALLKGNLLDSGKRLKSVQQQIGMTSYLLTPQSDDELKKFLSQQFEDHISQDFKYHKRLEDYILHCITVAGFTMTEEVEEPSEHAPEVPVEGSSEHRLENPLYEFICDNLFIFSTQHDLDESILRELFSKFTRLRIDIEDPKLPALFDNLFLNDNNKSIFLRLLSAPQRGEEASPQSLQANDSSPQCLISAFKDATDKLIESEFGDDHFSDDSFFLALVQFENFYGSEPLQKQSNSITQPKFDKIFDKFLLCYVTQTLLEYSLELKEKISERSKEFSYNFQDPESLNLLLEAIESYLEIGNNIAEDIRPILEEDKKIVDFMHSINCQLFLLVEEHLFKSLDVDIKFYKKDNANFCIDLYENLGETLGRKNCFDTLKKQVEDKWQEKGSHPSTMFRVSKMASSRLSSKSGEKGSVGMGGGSGS